MVRPVGKRPALQALVPIVYRMADLQGPKKFRCVPHPAEQRESEKLNIDWYSLLLLRISHY